MMVARGGDGRKAGNRPQAWALLCLLPLLLVLAVTAPAMRPVEGHLGSRLVRAKLEYAPAAGQVPIAVGKSRIFGSPKPWSFPMGNRTYRAVGGIDERWVRVGGWRYTLQWFQGRRVR